MPDGSDRVSDERAEAEPTHGSAGWWRALPRAVIVLLVGFVGLALIPDRLMALLSGRVAPALRDLLLLGWIFIATTATAWTLAIVQRPGRR